MARRTSKTVATVGGHMEHHGRDVTARLIHAAAPFSPPWLISATAYPLGAVAHERFGASPWATVGLTLADVAVSAVTWEAAKRRSPFVRMHAVATTAVGSGWLTAAAICGMSHAITNLWMLGGALVALSWNIRRAAHPGGEGEGGLWERVGLAKTRILKSSVEPNRVTAQLQLPRGELTGEDVSKARPQIASALSVPANGVRVMANPDRADQATLTVVPQDLLRESPSWSGPSAPGSTMVAPLVVGLHEDGAPMVIYAAADVKAGRGLVHQGIAGASGTGKGVGGRNLLAEIATRREVAVWMIDIVKRGQTFGCARELFDWFATSRAQAADMLDCLPEVIAARTDYLGERGYDNWQPGCGLTFLVVWIEEAAAVIRDDTQFIDTLAAARSAGVWVLISTQRWSHDNIPTSVRSNIGSMWCFGVRDATDAAIALGDDLVAAGADPSVWKADRPGYCYAAGGPDKDRHTVPGRTFGQPFGADPDTLAQLIADYAEIRDGLDETTTRAAGPAYTSRNGTTITPTASEATAEPRQTSSTPVVVDGEQVPAEVLRQVPDPQLPDSPEPEFYTQALANLDAELPAAIAWSSEDTQPEDTSPAMTPQEARDTLNAALRELAKSGHTEITATDLVDVLELVGRTRPWLVGEFRRLVDDRVLDKVRTGVYRIRPIVAERELANA